MSEEHPVTIPIPETTTETAEPAAVPVPVAAEPPPAAETAPPADQATPEAAAPEPVIKPHTDEPGLLQATPEAEPPKPAEEVEPEPGEPPVYEFTIPENFEIPTERLDEVRAIMTEANIPKEQAEKLWGMHTAAMEEFANRTLQAQHDAFAEYRRSERNKIAADPEVGGAGFETSKAAAGRMLDLIARDPGGDPAKTAANQLELNQWLSISGATDSYALFKGLTRLARILDEPQGGPPPQPKPPTAREQQGPRPRANGGAGRLEYTHPRGGART